MNNKYNNIVIIIIYIKNHHMNKKHKLDQIIEDIEENIISNPKKLLTPLHI